MDVIPDLGDTVRRICLDPKNHDLLTLVKALRNGLVYGTKMRLPHSAMLSVVSGHGTLKQRGSKIFHATREHACSLGLFVLLYKSMMLIMKRQQEGKHRNSDPFWAGLLGGYIAFGRSQGVVHQQVVMYVFTRTMLAFAALYANGKRSWSAKDEAKEFLQKYSWPAFASLSWASIMYLFRWYPDHLPPGAWVTMHYLFTGSGEWDSLKTFLLQKPGR